jgi:hypothetical protein
VLHDANAVAGLANRVLAYGADRILLGFPDACAARQRKREWVGNPLRDAITSLPPPRALRGRDGPLRLLVVGGSLGAQALNERVPAALARLPRRARRRSCTRRASDTSTRCATRTRERASRPNASRSSTTWRALRVGGPRRLPRRRDDGRRARGRGPGVDHRAAAGRDRRRADGQRAFLVDAGARVAIAQADSTPERLSALLAHDARAGARDGRRARTRRQARCRRARRRRCCATRGRAMKHKVKRVHFVGIGGAGMSGIAEVLATQGYRVSGSDSRERAVTRASRARRRRRDRPRGEQHRRRRRGRRLDRGAADNPRSRRRASAAFRSCRAR